MRLQQLPPPPPPGARWLPFRTTWHYQRGDPFPGRPKQAVAGAPVVVGGGCSIPLDIRWNTAGVSPPGGVVGRDAPVSARRRSMTSLT